MATEKVGYQIELEEMIDLMHTKSGNKKIKTKNIQWDMKKKKIKEH